MKIWHFFHRKSMYNMTHNNNNTAIRHLSCMLLIIWFDEFQIWNSEFSLFFNKSNCLKNERTTKIWNNLPRILEECFKNIWVFSEYMNFIQTRLVLINNNSWNVELGNWEFIKPFGEQLNFKVRWKYGIFSIAKV